MAERIVDHFAAETLRIIEEAPSQLIEVPGLGPKRTAVIGAAWEQQKAIKEVMLFLRGVGGSTSLAVRIYKSCADRSISVVREDPYRLAADVWGIGFKTADTIAPQVGEDPLEADLVIVDEVSLLDLLPAHKLVKAVPPGTHLLLVGDVDQLPSVAPARCSPTCSPQRTFRGFG